MEAADNPEMVRPVEGIAKAARGEAASASRIEEIVIMASTDEN